MFRQDKFSYKTTTGEGSYMPIFNCPNFDAIILFVSIALLTLPWSSQIIETSSHRCKLQLLNFHSHSSKLSFMFQPILNLLDLYFISFLNSKPVTLTPTLDSGSNAWVHYRFFFFLLKTADRCEQPCPNLVIFWKTHKKQNLVFYLI